MFYKHKPKHRPIIRMVIPDFTPSDRIPRDFSNDYVDINPKKMRSKSGFKRNFRKQMNKLFTTAENSSMSKPGYVRSSNRVFSEYMDLSIRQRKQVPDHLMRGYQYDKSNEILYSYEDSMMFNKAKINCYGRIEITTVGSPFKDIYLRRQVFDNPGKYIPVSSSRIVYPTTIKYKVESTDLVPFNETLRSMTDFTDAAKNLTENLQQQFNQANVNVGTMNNQNVNVNTNASPVNEPEPETTPSIKTLREKWQAAFPELENDSNVYYLDIGLEPTSHGMSGIKKKMFKHEKIQRMLINGWQLAKAPWREKKGHENDFIIYNPSKQQPSTVVNVNNGTSDTSTSELVSAVTSNTQAVTSNTQKIDMLITKLNDLFDELSPGQLIATGVMPAAKIADDVMEVEESGGSLTSEQIRALNQILTELKNVMAGLPNAGYYTKFYNAVQGLVNQEQTVVETYNQNIQQISGMMGQFNTTVQRFEELLEIPDTIPPTMETENQPMTNRRKSLFELVTKLVASQIETLLNTFSDKLAEKFNENERKIEELKKTINMKDSRAQKRVNDLQNDVANRLETNDKRMDLVENRASEKEYNMRGVMEAQIKVIQMFEKLDKQRKEEMNRRWESNQQLLQLLGDIKNGVQSNTNLLALTNQQLTNEQRDFRQMIMDMNPTPIQNINNNWYMFDYSKTINIPPELQEYYDRSNAISDGPKQQLLLTNNDMNSVAMICDEVHNELVKSKNAFEIEDPNKPDNYLAETLGLTPEALMYEVVGLLNILLPYKNDPVLQTFINGIGAKAYIMAYLVKPDYEIINRFYDDLAGQRVDIFTPEYLQQVYQRMVEYFSKHGIDVSHNPKLDHMVSTLLNKIDIKKNGIADEQIGIENTSQPNQIQN